MMGLSATAGTAAATPSGGISARVLFTRKAHSEELLAHFLGMALRAADLCVLFFLHRHLFFKDVVTPPAQIFIGWHLDHLF
jgi:hypothetical protein